MRQEGAADGRVLGGRYQLADVVGVGGMSMVWRARDEVLGRDVAVKVLSGRYATDPASRRRIRIEARAAAGLAHPNVAQVHDYGETDEDGQPTPYIVMELVPGPTLSERIAAGPIPVPDALRICAEIAAGLAAAHAEGLVHRDIKPANVILAPTGAKVVDFGIAVAAGTGEPGDERFGTPAYLAPERIADDAVTPASDVYSLGVLLYKLLTGRLPWPASSPAEQLEAHLRTPPDPLPPLDGVPPGVLRLAERCLAKPASERPSAQAMAEALADAAGIRVAAPAPPDPLRRRRTGLVAVGVATAAAVAGLVWVAAAAPGGTPTAEAGTSATTVAPAARPAGPGSSGQPSVVTERTTRVPVTVVEGSPAGTVPSPATAAPATTVATSAAPPPPPPPPPTTGAGDPPPKTFTSAGGTVQARCTTSGQAELTSWSAISPYHVDRIDAGPAATALASFLRGNQVIDMSVTCSGTTPAATITTRTR